MGAAEKNLFREALDMSTVLAKIFDRLGLRPNDMVPAMALLIGKVIATAPEHTRDRLRGHVHTLITAVRPGDSMPDRIIHCTDMRGVHTLCGASRRSAITFHMREDIFRKEGTNRCKTCARTLAGIDWQKAQREALERAGLGQVPR